MLKGHRVPNRRKAYTRHTTVNIKSIEKKILKTSLKNKQ